MSFGGLRTRLFIVVAAIVVLVLTASALALRQMMQVTIEKSRIASAIHTIDQMVEERRILLLRTDEVPRLIAGNADRATLNAKLEEIAVAAKCMLVLVRGDAEVLGVGFAGRGESRVSLLPDGRVRFIKSGNDRGLETEEEQVFNPEIFPLPDPQDPQRTLARLLAIPRSAFEPKPPSVARPNIPLTLDRRFNREILVVFLVSGLLVIAFVTFSFLRVLRPVRALTSAVERYGRGDRATRVAVTGRDELAQLATAFNTMAALIEKGEQLRRDLVADVAHELRTPLTNLRCQVESFQDGLAEPTAAAVHSLHEEILHLSRIVADLQDLALADAGELALARRRVPVAEVVNAVVRSMQSRFAAAGVALETELAPDLPELDADPDRLGQVLRNLLENAVAHTPAGGQVRITATAATTATSATSATAAASSGAEAGRQVELAITDTGAGIAPELLERVFDRFVRGDLARQRVAGGSGAGLGLSIVKSLVEAHGGTVRAHSETGRGARFVVALPAAGGSGGS